MNCLAKTFGRIIFATILFSSAYLHLVRPQKYTQNFSSNYHDLATSVNHYLSEKLLSADTINWQFFSKCLGLLEGIMAILIVFGDCWGGFLLLINLLVDGAFDFKDISNILQWNSDKKLEFARFIFLVGISFYLMSCSGSCKNQCQKKSVPSCQLQSKENKKQIPKAPESI